MVEEDRVRLPRIRPPQDDQVRFLDLSIGIRAPSGTENCRQTGDARRVSRPVTTINVIAAKYDAGELLRHEIRLVTCLRAAKQAERLGATLCDRRLKTPCRAGQGFVPGGWP